VLAVGTLRLARRPAGQFDRKELRLPGAVAVAIPSLRIQTEVGRHCRVDPSDRIDGRGKASSACWLQPFRIPPADVPFGCSFPSGRRHAEKPRSRPLLTPSSVQNQIP